MLLIAEALAAWLQEAGGYPWPRRLLTIARVATAGAAAGMLAWASRSLVDETNARRWVGALVLVAVGGVMSSGRPLDKVGLGPVKLGRVRSPVVPGHRSGPSHTQRFGSSSETPL